MSWVAIQKKEEELVGFEKWGKLALKTAHETSETDGIQANLIAQKL